MQCGLKFAKKQIAIFWMRIWLDTAKDKAQFQTTVIFLLLNGITDYSDLLITKTLLQQVFAQSGI